MVIIIVINFSNDVSIWKAKLDSDVENKKSPYTTSHNNQLSLPSLHGYVK